MCYTSSTTLYFAQHLSASVPFPSAWMKPLTTLLAFVDPALLYALTYLVDGRLRSQYMSTGAIYCLPRRYRRIVSPADKSRNEDPTPVPCCQRDSSSQRVLSDMKPRQPASSCCRILDSCASIHTLADAVDGKEKTFTPRVFSACETSLILFEGISSIQISHGCIVDRRLELRHG